MLGRVVVPIGDVECLKRYNGKVKSIPKADSGVSKLVSLIVLKISGQFIQPGSGKVTYHHEKNYASRQT